MAICFQLDFVAFYKGQLRVKISVSLNDIQKKK